MLNVTSGGIDKGAPPMCEGLVADAEKDRKEGRRNDGTEKDGVEAIALSRPFERAVDSIVAAFEVQDAELEAVDNFEFHASEPGT
jgi:hypothetical protein